jgi:hypothetical protein
MKRLFAPETLKRLCLAIIGVLLAAPFASAADPPTIKVLFLGDNGHHRPRDRFAQLQPLLKERGIDLTYSDKVADLNPKTLAQYDGLLIYANTERISQEQEKALLDYVAGGKGFIPIHCASYCFLNSDKYVELVGAQFQRHGTGTFRATRSDADHPILKGFAGFESWDETYVHTKHNDKGRTILEFRVDTSGREPWTWVREHGKGRVFYTAWGHDERTWGNAGFQNLIERGIRWAVGQDPGVVPAYAEAPEITPKRKDVKPFEYVDVGKKIPNYTPSRVWGTQGEPLSKMQLPLDPAESLKHYVTPVGFEVQLFAAEPDIQKPICMAFDERGRLWIAETIDYPNEKQPEGQGRDRIRICEDTNGDGRADKFTIFADKLSIPTSLVFYRGGVIVHQAPQTLYLKDTTGDDVADEKIVLFSGWSTGDTHAGPSNLRYGLDNWYYGIDGYSGFAGQIGGERQSFRQGFYRFQMPVLSSGEAKPAAPWTDGIRFEFLRNTNNNSWGVGISEEGVVFGSTANGNPSEYMPIANRFYESVRGWSSSVLTGIAGNPEFHPITENVRQVDYHHRFTAAAGHAIYTARTYPRDYWNRAAFISEPTGHLAATFLLQQSGAGYRSRNAWNLLASDDEWAAPIAADVGPDGNVWVIDWYNYIVQHNPTPIGFRTGRGNAYETDLRDKKHGRIYRVVYRGEGKEIAGATPFSLQGASPAKLVETLKHPNMLWRLHAQRLLVERGERDVAAPLVALVKGQNVDEIGLNVGAIHALWTLHGLGLLEGSHAEALGVATAALMHASAGVRRNAILVLPRNEPALAALLASGRLRDKDGQVRLAAMLALAEMPPSREAAAAIVESLSSSANVSDRWLLDAATSAAARHDVHFLQAVAAKSSLDSSAVLDRVAIVAEHFARGAPLETAGSVVASLQGAPAATAEAVLRGLERGWPAGQTLKEGLPDETLKTLLSRLPAESRGRLVRLAERMGSKALAEYAAEIAATLLAQAQNEKESESTRAAAARQYVEFNRTDAAAADEVLGLISPRTSPELAAGLLEAAGRSESPQAGPAILEAAQALTPAVRAAAWRVLLSRAEWTRALLDGLEAGKLQLAELSLEQRTALASHPERRIARRARGLLSRGGGLPNPDRQKVLEELLPLAQNKGDAALGKEVFKKTCAKCHTHSGEGTRIGPDLTGMAVHPKVELLTQMLDPSRSVEGNYRVYSVLMDDGRVFTGLLASETRTAIEIYDDQAQKQTLLREEIAQLSPSPKSFMPEGFEKQLSHDDFVNLLEFLTQRGKYLPIPLEKAATIVSTRGMFYSEDAPAERLVFSDWSPKTVEGVPFQLVDPQGQRVPNAILLYGPQGKFPPQMPKSVTLPCNAAAKAVHFLSGVSGWGYPYSEKGSVTMIVRLHYADGEAEDHELKNGEHFADYIRRVDVPESKLAFMLRSQQIRYLSVVPKRGETIAKIELVKGPDATAPVVMAVTVETR